MGTVQVYNADYMPLKDTSIARAIALILSGEAVILNADPVAYIRSENSQHPKPLSIRLTRYRRIPTIYKESHWSIRGVLERDNYTCSYCGVSAQEGFAVNVDHVLPRSRGGKNTWENTVCSCVKCNTFKADRTPQEAGMELLILPQAVMVVKFHSGKKNKKKNSRHS